MAELDAVPMSYNASTIVASAEFLFGPLSDQFPLYREINFALTIKYNPGYSLEYRLLGTLIRINHAVVQQEEFNNLLTRLRDQWQRALAYKEELDQADRKAKSPFPPNPSAIDHAFMKATELNNQAKEKLEACLKELNKTIQDIAKSLTSFSNNISKILTSKGATNLHPLQIQQSSHTIHRILSSRRNLNKLPESRKKREDLKNINKLLSAEIDRLVSILSTEERANAKEAIMHDDVLGVFERTTIALAEKLEAALALLEATHALISESNTAVTRVIDASRDLITPYVVEADTLVETARRETAESEAAGITAAAGGPEAG